MKKEKILLTGAAGTMGGAALKELLSPKHSGRFSITILDLPTERNRRLLSAYAGLPDLEILWGDLTDFQAVLPAVNGASYVLHAAALIPPAADHQPDLAWRVNVGAAENIVRAIKMQPDPDVVKLVNIGTVAETGDRRPPLHVGRTGDPILPSVFDMYGCAKAVAERIVAESGLRYWVSLRQTFMPTAGSAINPIMFHMPLDSCLEICTAHDAGLVLANVTSEVLPDDFWRRFYNIGGGPRARTTYYDFMSRVLALGGIKPLTAVLERNWFALRNFHCHWFEDAHILHNYLHHQTEGIEEYYAALKRQIPLGQKLAAWLTPNSSIRERVFRPVATATPDATQYWIEHHRQLRIAAFYNDRPTHDSIPDWAQYSPAGPDWYSYRRLDHGYDEDKQVTELDLTDMQEVAVFRGGHCLSTTMEPGELYTPLHWSCAFGHHFLATPNLVLKGGHWCPDCAPPGWNYDEQARRSPFISQVWHVHHDPAEDNEYPPSCVYDLQAG